MIQEALIPLFEFLLYFGAFLWICIFACGLDRLCAWVERINWRLKR